MASSKVVEALVGLGNGHIGPGEVTACRLWDQTGSISRGEQRSTSLSLAIAIHTAVAKDGSSDSYLSRLGSNPENARAWYETAHLSTLSTIHLHLSR